MTESGFTELGLEDINQEILEKIKTSGKDINEIKRSIFNRYINARDSKKLLLSRSIEDILASIDAEELGEILMNKVESIKWDDYNIIVLKIERENLFNENFETMKQLGSVEYGDWDSLRNFVSESEVERIKNQFDEDLEDLKKDKDSEIDDCLQIYTSVLYCNDEFVLSSMSTQIKQI